MDIKKVTTDGAPLPGGHYSQALVANNLVFVSGQLPIVPSTGEKILGTIEEQTRQVLNNIKAIVDAAGSDITKIVKVTVFISDISHRSGVEIIYTEFFGLHKPARAIIPVKDLNHGFKVEIDAIAVT
jgi:2-iminobutanoate/2-iminopropanoate deaminase